MKNLQLLKSIRKGIANPKNFHPWRTGVKRPHCVMGEFALKAHGWNGILFQQLFTFHEISDLIAGGSLTHREALYIVDTAIQRAKWAIQQKEEV